MAPVSGAVPTIVLTVEVNLVMGVATQGERLGGDQFHFPTDFIEENFDILMKLKRAGKTLPLSVKIS